MQFTVAQLRKLQKPYIYEETIDLSDELVGFEDILRADMANVKCVVNEVSKDKFHFQMNISINLTLQSAISLNEVPYLMQISCEEVFGPTDEEDEDINVYDGWSIDTKESILANIMMNKPMRATLEGEKLEYENHEESQDESEVNDAFKSLKDFYKK